MIKQPAHFYNLDYMEDPTWQYNRAVACFSSFYLYILQNWRNLAERKTYEIKDLDVGTFKSGKNRYAEKFRVN